MQTLKEKLASRKFWLSIAAMLASIGTAIAGFANASETIVITGVICTAMSAGIYAAVEAYIDAASVYSNNYDEDEDEIL